MNRQNGVLVIVLARKQRPKFQFGYQIRQFSQLALNFCFQIPITQTSQFQSIIQALAQHLPNCHLIF